MTRVDEHLAAVLAKHGVEIKRGQAPKHRLDDALSTTVVMPRVSLEQPTETDLLVAELRMLCRTVKVLPGAASKACVDCIDGEPLPADVEIYHHTDEGRAHDVRCRQHAVAFAAGVDPHTIEVLKP